MREAHREGAVPQRPGIDVRNRVGVTDDLDRGVQPGDGHGPVIGGQREPEIEIGTDGNQNREHQEAAEPGTEPPESKAAGLSAPVALHAGHSPGPSRSGVGRRSGGPR